MGITKIHARSVYDSRGNPTVEVDLVDSTGLHRAIVPSVSISLLPLISSPDTDAMVARVHQQASTRRTNCGMETRRNGVERVS
jgi:hypothetical protein